MNRKIIPIWLALAALVACNSEDIITHNQADEEITFSVGFAPDTRVAIDAGFESTWETGDAIGVFAVPAGQSLAVSGNYIHNAKLTYNAVANTWTPASPLYWISGGGALDFYAYYPYQDKADIDPTGIEFSIETDQSSNLKHKASDLMTTSPATENVARGTSVALNFAHRLCLLQVTVINNTGVAIDNDHFKITGITENTVVTINLATNLLDMIGVFNTPITFNHFSGNTYRAIVRLRSGYPLINLSFRQTAPAALISNTYTWNSEFDDGQVHRLTVTLNN